MLRPYVLCEVYNVHYERVDVRRYPTCYIYIATDIERLLQFWYSICRAATRHTRLTIRRLQCKTVHQAQAIPNNPFTLNARHAAFPFGGQYFDARSCGAGPIDVRQTYVIYVVCVSACLYLNIFWS